MHLCRGPACLCVLSAAHHSCVFVCDVYVSPSADSHPPLYVMCLSMRVSATCVSYVWAACACLTSASWRGAHVAMLVACHSSVWARHWGPCAPPHTQGSAGPCLSLLLPSLLAANATGEPVAMTTLHPPSSHPSADRLSAPPIPAALGGGALILPPPILPSPPPPQQPRLPSSSPLSASPSLHLSVPSKRGRGVPEPVSSPSLPLS